MLSCSLLRRCRLNPGLRTGGNQRDLAREKNLKKQAEKGKGQRSDDGLTFQQRQERFDID